MTKLWKPTPAPFKNYKKKVFEQSLLVSTFIHQVGEYPDLRKPSKKIPIKKIKSSEYRAKFNYLKRCLREYRKLTGKGRGITAVQVGIPEKFSVVYLPEKNEVIIIINPRITKRSKILLSYPEGCMSMNPVIVPTVRPSWIEFDYYDEKGKLNRWKDKKDLILNRVFQHEIDHMEGTINIDKIKDNTKIFLESDPEFYISAKFEKVKK